MPLERMTHCQSAWERIARVPGAALRALSTARRELIEAQLELNAFNVTGHCLKIHPAQNGVKQLTDFAGSDNALISLYFLVRENFRIQFDVARKEIITGKGHPLFPNKTAVLRPAGSGFSALTAADLELTLAYTSAWIDELHAGEYKGKPFADIQTYLLKEFDAAWFQIIEEEYAGTASYKAPPHLILQPIAYRDFSLTGRIGGGQFGAVFGAETADHHPRALKFLVPGPRPYERVEQRRLLHRESQVDVPRHPNIVTIYKYHPAGAFSPFIEMELIEGQTLQQIIEQRGPLTWEEAAPLARGILNGLAALHEHGFLHRDMKPSNVMVRNSDGEAVLLDFGIVKFFDTARGEGTKTMSIGTEGTAAPEQYPGPLKVGTYTDIFGAAAVLYYMLTGKYPYQHITEVTGEWSSHLPKPSDDVPDHVWNAIQRGLRAEPDQRPGDAAFMQGMVEGTIQILGPTGFAPGRRHKTRIKPYEPETFGEQKPGGPDHPLFKLLPKRPKFNIVGIWHPFSFPGFYVDPSPGPAGLRNMWIDAVRDGDFEEYVRYHNGNCVRGHDAIVYVDPITDEAQQRAQGILAELAMMQPPLQTRILWQGQIVPSHFSNMVNTISPRLANFIRYKANTNRAPGMEASQAGIDELYGSWLLDQTDEIFRRLESDSTDGVLIDMLMGTGKFIDVQPYISRGDGKPIPRVLTLTFDHEGQSRQALLELPGGSYFDHDGLGLESIGFEFARLSDLPLVSLWGWNTPARAIGKMLSQTVAKALGLDRVKPKIRYRPLNVGIDKTKQAFTVLSVDRLALRDDIENNFLR